MISSNKIFLLLFLKKKFFYFDKRKCRISNQAGSQIGADRVLSYKTK